MIAHWLLCAAGSYFDALQTRTRCAMLRRSSDAWRFHRGTLNVSTKILILCVAAAAAAAGSVEATPCPIAAQVSARRSTVVLGEPIDLTLVLKNTAAGAIEVQAPSEKTGNVRLSIADDANPTA